MSHSPINPLSNLLSSAREGSREAEDLLFRQVRCILRDHLQYNHISDNLQSKIDPSDIVQQTLLEIHSNMWQYQGETDCSFLDWAHSILINRLLDHCNSFNTQKRNNAKETSWELLPPPIIQNALALDTPSPPTRVQLIEQLQSLEKAMNELPEMDRELLLLRHAKKKMEYEEIARKMIDQSPQNYAETNIRKLADALRQRCCRLLKHLQKRISNE